MKTAISARGLPWPRMGLCRPRAPLSCQATGWIRGEIAAYLKRDERTVRRWETECLPLLPNTPKWSPDGSQIVFTDDQGHHACIVASRGGSPQRLLPEGNGLESDPGWSPDGKIIFATGLPGSRESSIRIFDLASHQITTLPGSDGKFSPHWSPDGRFIEASSLDVTTLYLFDTQTQHWSTLYKGIGSWHTWSALFTSYDLGTNPPSFA